MEAKQLLDRINWRTGGALLVLMAGVVLFWNTWAVYPLKILVVFFHELSHGLAAWITGGSIERIELVAQQGGLCVTRGGSTFLTLSAGYLGSLFWGGLILVVAARTRHDTFRIQCLLVYGYGPVLHCRIHNDKHCKIDWR